MIFHPRFQDVSFISTLTTPDYYLSALIWLMPCSFYRMTVLVLWIGLTLMLLKLHYVLLQSSEARLDKFAIVS